MAEPANDILDTWDIGWDELLPDDPDEPKPIGKCINCGAKLYESDPHVWTGWMHSVLECKACHDWENRPLEEDDLEMARRLG